MQFRIKDTRFKVVPARGNRALLYRSEANGSTETGGWTFLGEFDGESDYRARAQREARKRSLHSRTPGIEHREDITGALQHSMTRVRMPQ